MLELINYDGMTDCHGITGSSITRMHIHFYLLDDLLIDTGSSRLGRFSSAFFSKHVIRYAALTHVHEDHSGMAHWLTQKLGVPVFLHEGDHADAVSPRRLPLYRNVVWGNRRPFYPAAMPSRISTDRYDLDVIPSPGHSPNHVVFHEKSKGWLFTGDLYIAPKQNVSFCTENTLQAIASIRRLLTLDWGTIFCAHSGIKHNGKEKLRLKLEFFETIQKHVEDKRDKGFSLEEINRCLFPKKNLWELVSRGEWSSFRLISTAVK